MKTIVTTRFQENLQFLLQQLCQQLSFEDAKNFKLYLDTIIINIPTKLHKYKTSSLFNNEHIKEIDFKGLKIFFYHDPNNEKIILLSIA